MLQGLQKIKSKQELRPKFSVTQEIRLNNNIYLLDLNSDIDSDRILQICKTFQTDEYKEKKQDSVYAWRSDYFTCADNPISEFEELFDVVRQKVSNLDENPYEYLVHHYWFAIYGNKDGSKKHNHGTVDFACVYYANAPDKSAPLVIPSLNGNIEILPKKGLLVIMPGTCYHYVPESEHQGDRVIVAMNLIRSKLKKE